MDTDPILPHALPALSSDCYRETAKYRAGQPNDERPCLELFRRAIVEDSTDAWAFLVGHYQPQVRTWVVRCLTYQACPADIEAVTHDALARFWRFFRLDSWLRMKGLSQILAYMHACARSAVAQAGRERQKHALETALDELGPRSPTHVTDGLEADDLWALITRHCRDEADLFLARSVLAGDLKPREVLAHFPHLFQNIEDVYRRKRNLLERLQRDTILAEQYGWQSSKTKLLGVDPDGGSDP